MSKALSRKMRSNLAEIYRLIDRQPDGTEFVTSSQLAEALAVSPPAVNRMVNKLGDEGMLLHRRYQGVAMTESGSVEALKHIRHQRIAEVFLARIMEMDWLDAHDEARRLSAGLSEKVARRMYELCGSPAVCPHGEPIPDEAGALPPRADILLSQVEAGVTVRVSRLITRDRDRLQYLEALGLLPGTVCEVIHVAPFDGPMQLRLGREFRIIGNSLAQLIRAEVASP